MNMFDIIVLVVAGLSILRGLWRGLIRQVVGLAGVAAGYMIAMRFYESLSAGYLRGFTPATGRIVAFLCIFIVCIVAASIVGWIIGKLMNVTGLGMLDRIGGAVLGGAKGCFILAVAVMMLLAFLPKENGILKGSRTIEYIQPMARVISALAPQNIKTRYDQRTGKKGNVAAPAKPAKR